MRNHDLQVIIDEINKRYKQLEEERDTVQALKETAQDSKPWQSNPIFRSGVKEVAHKITCLLNKEPEEELNSTLDSLNAINSTDWEGNAEGTKNLIHLLELDIERIQDNITAQRVQISEAWEFIKDFYLLG